MAGGYWFVQQYREGGSIDDEQPCDSCAAVVKKVQEYKKKNTNPQVRLRVHVPSHATFDERRKIDELGVESF